MTKNERRLIEWLSSFKDKKYHNPLEKSYQFDASVTDPLVEAGQIEGDGKGGFRKVGKLKKAVGRTSKGKK